LHIKKETRAQRDAGHVKSLDDIFDAGSGDVVLATGNACCHCERSEAIQMRAGRRAERKHFLVRLAAHGWIASSLRSSQ